MPRRSVTVTPRPGPWCCGICRALTPHEPFASRRIYRAEVGTGRYELVAEINADDTMFVDHGTLLGGELQEYFDSIRTRVWRDVWPWIPGTIVKLDRTRIDATFGAQFISEGTRRAAGGLHVVE